MRWAQLCGQGNLAIAVSNLALPLLLLLHFSLSPGFYPLSTSSLAYPPNPPLSMLLVLATFYLDHLHQVVPPPSLPSPRSHFSLLLLFPLLCLPLWPIPEDLCDHSVNRFNSYPASLMQCLLKTLCLKWIHCGASQLHLLSDNAIFILALGTKVA